MATKSSNTRFTKAVNNYTATVNGVEVKRNLNSSELQYVNGLMKESYYSVVDDLSSVKPATHAAWQKPIKGLNSETQLHELVPEGVANKLKNNPNADNCVIINHVDLKIREYFNWPKINGVVRDSAVWYIGDYAYVIPAADAEHANNAALAYAQWKSRLALDESTGTCSNAGYLNRTSCEANSETWTSSIDPAEITDLDTKYNNEINLIT